MQDFFRHLPASISFMVILVLRLLALTILLLSVAISVHSGWYLV